MPGSLFLALSALPLAERARRLTHSLADGPLGGFQFVAALPKAAVDILVRILVRPVFPFVGSVFGVVSEL